MISYQEVVIALERLQTKSTQLNQKPPASIQKDHNELLQEVRKKAEGSARSRDPFEGKVINDIWLEFEDWSRDIWNELQVTDPLAGRAFTFGASLADTYWHADGEDLVEDSYKDLEGLLRKYRLDEIIARFDSIADHLPAYAADVIHHSLIHWQIADRLRSMQNDEKAKVLSRLKAQAKVWRDILFGLQRPEGYLREADRRRIVWTSNIYTAMLIILVGLIVWLAVLLLAGSGRMLLASASGVSNTAGFDSQKIIEQLINYQNWSSLLATLSSVVVVLTGIITRLSGWIINFRSFVKDRLTLSAIKKRTYRDWRKSR
jgi:hypothetical protein